MSNQCFVGIDTSNYTTSAAVCTKEGEIIANLKCPLPVREGECGLRQSDAVFAHVRNLPDLMQQLSMVLRGRQVLAVGYSAYPREAEGSYMPCFLSGKAAAQSLAAGVDVPTYAFSHQDGHIMAALYSCGSLESLIRAPFVAFHVSGGTTEVLYATPQPTGFSVRLIGETLDLNAGQAIDRVGVMMGLQFPCGKEMEALSATCTEKLPKPRICVREGSCHLSGLQNLAEKLWQETHNPARVSAYVFAFIGETLKAMTNALDEKYPQIPVVYAGGVMSNRTLQATLGKRINTYFAQPAFSADNAAGCALLCRQKYLYQA